MQLQLPSNFIGAHTRLVPADLVAEAAALQVRLAIIHAFSDLESGALGGFLATGEPTILYEARYFHLLTGGKYDRVAPNISSPIWDRSLYGAGGVHQYARLRQAMALDRTAALESCSIGRYQQMAADWHMLGFSSVDDMWAAFCDSEKTHLEAFGAFCSARGMLRSMRMVPPDCVHLAILYNGTGERANHYDEKLLAADRHFEAAGEGKIPSPPAHSIGLSHAELPSRIGLPYIGA